MSWNWSNPNPPTERVLVVSIGSGLGGYLGAHASFAWAGLAAAFGALVFLLLYEILAE